jgi:hypothetical protein
MDVLASYQYYDSGQLAEYYGQDPPYILVEGISLFHRAMERIKQKQIEIEREKEKRRRRATK